MQTANPTPTMMCLEERVTWIRLCHPDPASCDTCMDEIAHFLAEEMEYELDVVLDRSAQSYQAELGEDRCTLDRAMDLRRMTVAWCYQRSDAAAVTVADFEDAPPAEPVPTTFNDQPPVHPAIKLAYCVGIAAMVALSIL